jgi:TFIIF-interacting CTD phosphatase-like protein
MGMWIVLDLDATLLQTHADPEEDKCDRDPLDKFKELRLFSSSKNFKLRKRTYKIKMINSWGDCTGEVGTMYGVFRPHIDEFLDFLGEYAEGVIVWTAGIRRYADELCNKIFMGHKKPLLIYSKEMNEYDPVEDCDVLKPLSKLYEEMKSKGYDMNEKNTLIIDDNDGTFKLNPNNAIEIPRFICDINKKEITTHKDDALLKIMKWLNTKEVRESKDVRKLDKSRIFKNPLK